MYAPHGKSSRASIDEVLDGITQDVSQRNEALDFMPLDFGALTRSLSVANNAGIMYRRLLPTGLE